MGIDYEKGEKGAVIRLTGRVGIEEASGLFTFVKENIGREITLEMQDAELIDTSILQIVIALDAEAKIRGTDLHIIAPPLYLLEILFKSGSGRELRIN